MYLTLGLLLALIISIAILVKRKLLNYILILILILIIIAVTNFIPFFRIRRDLLFNNTDFFLVKINENSFSLPLPHKTVIVGKDSEESANFVTTLSNDDILKFYSSCAIVKDNTFIYYNGITYQIVFKDYDIGNSYEYFQLKFLQQE